MELKEKFKSIFKRCGIWYCIGNFIDFIITLAFSILGIIWSVSALMISLIVGVIMYIAFYWDKSFLKLNFTLYVFSVLMKLVLFPLGLIYKIVNTLLFANSLSTENLSNYYRRVAISNDQAGNVYLEELFNNTLITEDGYKFGNPDETISGVIGKNYYNNTLRIAGKVFAFILELLDKGHLNTAIERDENWRHKRSNN